MRWFARTHARRPQRRPGTFRPRLEGLEDRLTPSTLVGVDASAQSAAVPPQPIGQESLVSLVPSPATQVSGSYVTGAAGSATAEGVAVGADGSVYVTGYLNDPTVGPNQVAYVAKYGPTGSLVYSAAIRAFADTDVGSTTEGTAIAVDGSGNAYISGRAHHSTDNSDNGLYIKLDPTGTMFVYGLIQGSGPLGGPVSTNGVAIDTAGDAVFTGEYSPSPFEHDLLAARFTPSGTETYGFFYTFGPGSSSQGNAAAMPGTGASTTIAGFANIPGTTTSQNATVVKLDALGNPTAAGVLVDPTTDSLNAVALDTAGNIYAAGTFDIGGPTQSAGVVKSDSGITTVIWSVAPAPTAFTGNGIAVDGAGNVYVTGADSSGQAYLAKLSGVDGSTTDYKVFGGTGGSDVGNAVAFRPSDGTVFVVGTTNSSDFPVTDGSTLNGTTDGFLTQWSYP
jgi:hypothetical protein